MKEGEMKTFTCPACGIDMFSPHSRGPEQCIICNAKMSGTDEKIEINCQRVCSLCGYEWTARRNGPPGRCPSCQAPQRPLNHPEPRTITCPVCNWSWKTRLPEPQLPVACPGCKTRFQQKGRKGRAPIVTPG